LNELHAGKNATPTMGGLFIVTAIIVAAVLCADLTNVYVQQSLVLVLGFGLLGAYDDWIKIRTTRRGLTVRQKFLGQFACAGLLAVWLFLLQRDKPFGLELIGPIGPWSLSLGMGFMLWAMLVMVGSSNGVNLTDGLDGL